MTIQVTFQVIKQANHHAVIVYSKGFDCVRIVIKTASTVLGLSLKLLRQSLSTLQMSYTMDLY